MPFKYVGYNMNVVGIKTNKQTMLWKDNGIGARFLGLINHDDNTVYVSGQKKDEREKPFNTMQELNKEITKRSYNDIKGLKANITEKDYMYYLEVLPPLQMGNNWFILSECLSDNLYYKFTSHRKENTYLCEVVELDDEQLIKLEVL